MYLKEIHLKNIKTFRDLRVDFTHDNKPRLWTGFLGPNGMGKSILLQCIAVALAGEAAIREVLPVPRTWLRTSEDHEKSMPDKIVQSYGLIEAKIDVSDESENHDELLIRYFVVGEKGLEMKGRFLSGPGILSDQENKDNDIFERMTGYESRGFLVCGYGPFRRLPREGERTESISYKHPRASRLTTMFNEGAPVSDLEEWLADLEYRAIKKGDEAKNTYNTALIFLREILPQAKFKEITDDRKVIFTTPDGDVSINELSDGYRSVIAWSANLIKNIFEAYPDLDDPFKASGIVIVLFAV